MKEKFISFFFDEVDEATLLKPPRLLFLRVIGMIFVAVPFILLAVAGPKIWFTFYALLTHGKTSVLIFSLLLILTGVIYMEAQTTKNFAMPGWVTILQLVEIVAVACVAIISAYHLGITGFHFIQFLNDQATFTNRTGLTEMTFVYVIGHRVFALFCAIAVLRKMYNR